MTCGLDKWIAGDWHYCVFNPVTSIIGDGVFGLVLGAAIWASLYFAGSGRPTTPTAVCIILSTLMFPIIPNQYTGIAWSILLVGAAGVILQSLQKYVLSPATQ